MIKVGITGGIGSGKSVVSAILRSMGYPVYDSDTRSKILTNSNNIIRQKLTALLGSDTYKSGILNKPLLAEYIFTSKENLKKVNAIIHPQVFVDFNDWCNIQASDVVFAESAILFDSGFNHFLDKVLVISAPESLRLERVKRRDGASQEQVKNRMQMQKAEGLISQKADFILKNDDKTSLIEQIHTVLNQLQVGDKHS